jgi:23S rRNA (uracil1939-C5)-methyltransferase
LLLTVEKMIYGGDGLARMPADEKGRGKAVFVPFVLPGEKIEATITEQKPGFARARPESVLQPSPHRVEPACPYFRKCGGCHYQHAGYEQQLAIKKEVLFEALKRTARLDMEVEAEIHPSPLWNYRNRSRLKVQIAPQFQAGYFKMSSHELLAVEQCPVSSPLINAGIAALWQSGRAGKVPGGVSEIEFFANAEDTQLLIEVSAKSDTRRATLRAWAEDFRSSMPEIVGVVVSREWHDGSRHTLERLLTLGADHLMYRTARVTYRVSAGSFFQTNRFLTDELVRIVTEGQSGEVALDLYAGVGLFSTALCDMRHIIAVEPSPTSTGDLSCNLPSKAEVVRATTEQYLSGSAKSRRPGKGGSPARPLKPDLAVVDPPRAGLGERVAGMLVTLGTPRVIYVSCDPVTLARDLVVLLAGGYRIEKLHMVDLFPQTFHLETVVHLAH